MAARKDDGQGPPGSGRPTPIWRLPTAQSTDASDASDSSASSDREADRPTSRRVPQPVVWGLAAALVCVGLYAAWATVGPDILGTSEKPDVAAAPTTGESVAEQAGGGQTSGGTAAAPPADGEGTPLVVAEEDAEGGARAEPLEDPAAAVGADQSGDAAFSADVAAVVVAPQESEPDPPVAATPEPISPALDAPSPSPALAEDSLEATAPAASARDDEASPAGDAADVPARAATDAGGDAQPGTPPPAMVEVGADALGMLDARLDALETESADALGAGAAVTALEQRIQALEQDPTREAFGRALAAWEEQRATLEAALADVKARLARFEEEASRQAAADGHVVGLVLTTGDLMAALGSARPFAPVLDAFRGIAGEDPEIESALARLAPFAATGVPTLDGLIARFPEAANAIVRAAPAAEDSDWIDETVTKLSQLVTIRRTGGAIDPKSLDGRLVQAEAALTAGDLGRAIAIVDALVLDADETGSAEPWLRDARARAEVDDALAGLVATVHARVGARWASTGRAQ